MKWSIFDLGLWEESTGSTGPIPKVIRWTQANCHMRSAAANLNSTKILNKYAQKCTMVSPVSGYSCIQRKDCFHSSSPVLIYTTDHSWAILHHRINSVTWHTVNTLMCTTPKAQHSHQEIMQDLQTPQSYFHPWVYVFLLCVLLRASSGAKQRWLMCVLTECLRLLLCRSSHSDGSL